MLFHNVVSLCCPLNTPFRYIFQLFSTTCWLGWWGGGEETRLCLLLRRGPGRYVYRVGQSSRTRYASVRVCEVVATECRGGHVVRRSMVTMVTYTRVLATLYNLQHCHSAQPVRHTQARCRGSLCNKNNSQYRIWDLFQALFLKGKPETLCGSLTSDWMLNWNAAKLNIFLVYLLPKTIHNIRLVISSFLLLILTPTSHPL